MNVRCAFAFILCLSLLLFAGCGQDFKASDLPGTYTASYPVATEQLILKSNGVFQQKVVLSSDRRSFSSRGKWFYDSYDDSVSLDGNYLSVVDAFGQQQKNFQQAGISRTSLPIKTNPLLNLGGDESPVNYRKQ